MACDSAGVRQLYRPGVIEVTRRYAAIGRTGQRGWRIRSDTGASAPDVVDVGRLGARNDGNDVRVLGPRDHRHRARYQVARADNCKLVA